MPNPVTQSILKKIQEPRLAEFVNRWDALEEVVISVFREQTANPSTEMEYDQLRAWLLHSYPEWQPRLEPFWRQSRIKDQVGIDDPFMFLLQIKTAGELVGNWNAVKHLPAAREALNQFLLVKIGS